VRRRKKGKRLRGKLHRERERERQESTVWGRSDKWQSQDI